jgi:hypothetical protein
MAEENSDAFVVLFLAAFILPFLDVFALPFSRPLPGPQSSFPVRVHPPLSAVEFFRLTLNFEF